MIKKGLSSESLFVWKDDPAVLVGPAMEEAMARGDANGIPLKNGEKPTLFWTKPLSMTAYQSLLAEYTDLGKCVAAIQYGLSRVENIEIDGESFQLKDEHFEKDGSEKRIKKEVLERMFDFKLFSQLGAHIIERSSLNPE